MLKWSFALLASLLREAAKPQIEPAGIKDYGCILMPVRHIEPAEPIYDLRQSAIHGWHTLSRIFTQRPAITDIHFQNPHAQQTFTWLGDTARETTRAIEQQSPDAFFIPMSDIEKFRSSRLYIRAVAEAYYEKGTLLRLHEPADNIDTTNVTVIFAKRANLADRAAGRECAHILNEFVAGLDRLHRHLHFKELGIARQEPPRHIMSAPSPLPNRRSHREP